jgi:hypothetical protein
MTPATISPFSLGSDCEGQNHSDGFAKAEETATVHTTPNVVSWSMQVALLGRPMKSKEQRKQQVREVSRM